MSSLSKKINIFFQRSYHITLDWLYVLFWQLYDFIKRGNPHMYESPQKPHETAVIIIPGVYEPWQFMRPLSMYLYAHRYRVYVIQGLGYNTGSIASMAELAHDVIASLPHEHFFIVAHSKGGLIGKYLLANQNQDKRIRHMVAINTPFSGSVYANYAPIKSLRLFSPRDAILKTLLANRLVNTSITSIYSKFDPNIPGGSHLDGARNVPMPTIGHFRIIASSSVHDRILSIFAHHDASINTK